MYNYLMYALFSIFKKILVKCKCNIINKSFIQRLFEYYLAIVSSKEISAKQ